LSKETAEGYIKGFVIEIDVDLAIGTLEFDEPALFTILEPWGCFIKFGFFYGSKIVKLKGCSCILMS
jgi:hypothetical protein